MESKRVERLWRRSKTNENATAPMRERVREARRFAARRCRTASDTPTQDTPVPNVQALSPSIPLEGRAERLLLDAARRWSLSARAVHRTLRVARTIADLAGAETIAEVAVAEALSYRADTHGR